MPFVAVPDRNSGDVYTTAMWTTYLEGNLNAGVTRPIYDSGPLAIAASSIDITSIPQTFAGLRLFLDARGDAAATAVSLSLRLNNDSGTNYDWQLTAGVAAAASAQEAVAATSIFSGDVAAATAPAGVSGGCYIDIPNYAGATFNKRVLILSGNKTGIASGNFNARFVAGFWRNTAAITRLTVTPGSGNFAAGSRVVLYGLGGLV